MIDYVAGQLADADALPRSRQFPYQYLAAYLNASDEVPSKIKSALHDAAEIMCGNVPKLPGPVIIGLDTSGYGDVAGRKDRARHRHQTHQEYKSVHRYAPDIAFG